MISQRIIQSMPALRRAPGLKVAAAVGSPTPHIDFTRGDFQVKTVRSNRDLRQVQSLRYDVFHREFKQSKFPFGLDLDRFDAWSDHLVIVDRKTGCFVGTYRLLLEDRAPYFYSETEFDMHALKALPGKKLELSRACIHRDYRNGVIIGLLWRGLVHYIQAAGVDYLFGMSSLKSTDPSEIARVYQSLSSSGSIDEMVPVRPTGQFVIPGFHGLVDLVSRELPPDPEMVPPLLRSYIRAGAKVIGEPALDKEFRCADFVTLLEMSKLGKAYERKFKFC